MIFRVLDTDGEIASAFELMAQLRDQIERQTFVADIRAQQSGGFVLVGGFDPQDRLVVLAGLRSTRTLSRGPHLFIDDLVTDKSVRGKGYGKQMLHWIARYASDMNLPFIHLDSRDTAKGFYEQVGFNFHTSIPCRIEVSKLLS